MLSKIPYVTYFHKFPTVQCWVHGFHSLFIGKSRNRHMQQKAKNFFAFLWGTFFKRELYLFDLTNFFPSHYFPCLLISCYRNTSSNCCKHSRRGRTNCAQVVFINITWTDADWFIDKKITYLDSESWRACQNRLRSYSRSHSRSRSRSRSNSRSQLRLHSRPRLRPRSFQRYELENPRRTGLININEKNAKSLP